MLHQSIESPLGLLTASWTVRGLYRLSFGSVDSNKADQNTTEKDSNTGTVESSGQQALAAWLDAYFSRDGELAFPLAQLDWSDVPEFHQRVLRQCAQIAAGSTLTYGRLAAAVGSPGAARAVGQAMARNRWPLIVPCHRVVGHSGRLTGYSGAGGIATKRRLLDFENGSLTPAFLASDAADQPADNLQLLAL